MRWSIIFAFVLMLIYAMQTTEIIKKNQSKKLAIWNRLGSHISLSIHNFYKNILQHFFGSHSNKKKGKNHPLIFQPSINRNVSINPILQQSRLLSDSTAYNDSLATLESDLSFGSLTNFSYRKTTEKYYVKYLSSMTQYINEMSSVIPTQKNTISCLNGGIAIDVQLLQFKCNNENVSKSQYEQEKSGGKCSSYVVNSKLCYCPRDYYGIYCERLFPLFCRFELISPSENDFFCERSNTFTWNSEYYDKSRFGIPPCVFTDSSRSINISGRLNCQSHSQAIEGFKNLNDYVQSALVNYNKYYICYYSICLLQLLAEYNSNRANYCIIISHPLLYFSTSVFFSTTKRNNNLTN